MKAEIFGSSSHLRLMVVPISKPHLPLHLSSRSISLQTQPTLSIASRSLRHSRMDLRMRLLNPEICSNHTRLHRDHLTLNNKADRSPHRSILHNQEPLTSSKAILNRLTLNLNRDNSSIQTRKLAEKPHRSTTPVLLP